MMVWKFDKDSKPYIDENIQQPMVIKDIHEKMI